MSSPSTGTPAPPGPAPGSAPASPPADGARIRRLSIWVTWTATVVLLVLMPIGLLALQMPKIYKEGLVNAEKQVQHAVVDIAWRQIEGLMNEAREVGHRVGYVLLSDSGLSDD